MVQELQTGEAGDAITSIQDPSAYGGEILVAGSRGHTCASVQVGGRWLDGREEKQQTEFYIGQVGSPLDEGGASN